VDSLLLLGSGPKAMTAKMAAAICGATTKNCAQTQLISAALHLEYS